METNEYQWKAARISLQRNRKTRGKIKIKFGIDFNDGMGWNAAMKEQKGYQFEKAKGTGSCIVHLTLTHFPVQNYIFLLRMNRGGKLVLPIWCSQHYLRYTGLEAGLVLEEFNDEEDDDLKWET
ncbi:hypothetical protein NC651_000698 [Populus alba x Populus x berolinensis]|nr:hypothetical protein NC651_000698 [Populus alba x Populus x berolinensis]